MQFNNEKTRNVAEIAAKIMAGETVSEELKGGQKKIDKNHNGKIDGQDFAILRGQKKTNEEIEQIDELLKSTLGSYINKASSDAATSKAASANWAHVSTKARNPRVKAAAEKYSDEEEARHKKRLAGIGQAVKKVTKEEIEQIQEYESKDGKYVHKGTYGYSGKGAEHGETDYKKENDLAKAADKPAKAARKKYGARQNYVRSSRVNEGFSNLITSLQENGLKGLEEGMKSWKAKKEMKEEADNDQFHSEVEKAKKKNAGEDKNDAGVAAGSVQAVKNEEIHKQVQVVDMTDPNEIKTTTVDLEERHMTEPEMKKREEIVKSMKKGIAGFKERYGDRAKSVMYATATKQAMKEETESEHYKAGHEHAVNHALDSGFKVTARARKKEMLADNPHKPGTPEHKEWHRGALDGHQTGLDNM